MNSKELMLEILKKTRLTPEKLAERTNISLKELNRLLDKNKELSISDYQKLSKYFNLSIDALATGRLDDNDKYYFERLEPSGYELIDEFIKGCTEIIKDAGFYEQKDKLIPKPLFIKTDKGERFQGFEGGIFLVNDRNGIHRILTERVRVSLTKLLEQDNYELFSNIRESGRIVDDSDPREIKVLSTLKYEYIASNSDLRFLENIDISHSEGEIIYKVDENTFGYWEKVNILLKKGAYLTRAIQGKWDRVDHEKDIPATMIFKYIVKQNLK